MNLLKYILFIIVLILSYWLGFYSYEYALWIGWNETIGNDRQAVLFWAFIPYVLILVPLYFLICNTVKSKVSRPFIRIIAYPSLCALIFIIPTFFIMSFFNSFDFFSPEALLFYVFFASAGIVFGLGYGGIVLLFDKMSNRRSLS